MRSLAHEAMKLAYYLHETQRRRYTDAPYVTHLAEVAGIAMSVGWHNPEIHPDKFMAVCWLHDCMEDQGIKPGDLEPTFGPEVEMGVSLLSDLESGNRATRKVLARQRLAAAPGWVQTIKVADLISNTPSIIQHDPGFAEVYVEEVRQYLGVMTRADHRLLRIARDAIVAAEERPERMQ